MSATENVSRRFAGLSGTRKVLLAVGALVLTLIGWRWITVANGQTPPDQGKSAKQLPTSVQVAAAARSDMPIYLEGIGNAQAFYTVNIKSRVDGELQKIGFIEGQTVHKGDLLAQIDPRPFQAALDLAAATKAKDEAQLANARSDLERYSILAPQELASKQTVETQRALVAQLEAQIKGDQASIDNARTQLDYARITSPIEGRTGIRQVDPGNNVHSTDTNGIVVVTQVQPISVIFTVPEDAVPAINAAMAAGTVNVEALSRDEKQQLDRGTLTLIDNQIDQSTGTVRLKATFPNVKNALWPGEFVNARVLVRNNRNALTIPSTAVLRSVNGMFTYVAKNDSTVEARPIKTGLDNGILTVIESGLREGEQVVTTNQFRLQPGASIHVGKRAGNPSATTAAEGSKS